MAERIHTKNEYRNVYALQVLNEPVRSGENADQAGNMVWNFYPEAWRRIRAREAQLGTSSQKLLHIIFMVRTNTQLLLGSLSTPIHMHSSPLQRPASHKLRQIH